MCMCKIMSSNRACMRMRMRMRMRVRMSVWTKRHSGTCLVAHCGHEKERHARVLALKCRSEGRDDRVAPQRRMA